MPRAITRGSTPLRAEFFACGLSKFSRVPSHRIWNHNLPVKRPGRNNAGSRTSGRLVAAIRMTPSFASNPSISRASGSKSVHVHHCHRQARATMPSNRINFINEDDTRRVFLPLFKHVAHATRTTPTNISTKSEPEIVKNGTLASPAIALASNVLPVPGGPTSNTPFGILPPRR